MARYTSTDRFCPLQRAYSGNVKGGCGKDQDSIKVEARGDKEVGARKNMALFGHGQREGERAALAWTCALGAHRAVHGLDQRL